MKKMSLIALVLVILMLFAACAPAPTASSEPASSEPSQSAAQASEEPSASASEAASAGASDNPNAADFTYVEADYVKDGVFDISNYYSSLGVDCNVTIKEQGGVVRVKDEMTTQIPKANEKYKIGFSVYYTVDEVGTMILNTMKQAAEAAGVELLVNDANYDQNAQNQAIEQWITEGVDGVILAPCDFTAVKGALDALEKANIPVVSMNPPLAGNVDSVVMIDCIEEGQMAANLLIDALKAEGKEVKGKIVYQTLPFVHPNAATRTKGFKDTFADYPDVEFIELTGTSPEEHYTAFEGALQANPDMIGAWGLYSSATIGMNNAKKAAKSDVLLTSIDNDKPILAGIKEGSILGSACYSGITSANWCMIQMVNILNGVQDIPAAIFYENQVVTADNVDAMFDHYYPESTVTLEEYMSGKTE